MIWWGLLALSCSSGHLTCWAPMGMEKASLGFSSPWQPVHTDLCLSVSRLVTLQSHLCHSNRRKLQLTLAFQMLWIQHFNPRSQLLTLCSFLVRNCLTPGLGGLRTTGWEGGFWDVSDIGCWCGAVRIGQLSNWSCQLNQQEIKSMNFRGREGITYITTACNFGQEVNYKFFTPCKISRHKENQSSLPLSVCGGLQ